MSENNRPPKPLIQPQSVKLMAEEPRLPAVDDSVQYEKPLKGGIESSTVYLLPIKRSALSTGLVANQIAGGKRVVNVEEHVYGKNLGSRCPTTQF